MNCVQSLLLIAQQPPDLDDWTKIATIAAAVFAGIALIFSLASFSQAKAALKLAREANKISGDSLGLAQKEAIVQSGTASPVIRIHWRESCFEIGSIDDLANADLSLQFLNLGEYAIDKARVTSYLLDLSRGSTSLPVNSKAVGWKSSMMYDFPEAILQQGRAEIDLKQHLIEQVYRAIPSDATAEHSLLLNVVVTPQIYGQDKPTAMLRSATETDAIIKPQDRLPITIRIVGSSLSEADRKTYFDSYQPSRYVSNEFSDEGAA